MKNERPIFFLYYFCNFSLSACEIVLVIFTSERMLSMVRTFIYRATDYNITKCVKRRNKLPLALAIFSVFRKPRLMAPVSF